MLSISITWVVYKEEVVILEHPNILKRFPQAQVFEFVMTVGFMHLTSAQLPNGSMGLTIQLHNFGFSLKQ